MSVSTSTPGRAQPGVLVPGDLGLGVADLTVVIGITVSRAQVQAAGGVQGNGKSVSTTRGDGKSVRQTVRDRSR